MRPRFASPSATSSTVSDLDYYAIDEDVSTPAPPARRGMTIFEAMRRQEALASARPNRSVNDVLRFQRPQPVTLAVTTPGGYTFSATSGSGNFWLGLAVGALAGIGLAALAKK